MVYPPIAAVTGWRVKDNASTEQPKLVIPDEPKEKPKDEPKDEPEAQYKDAYLLLRHRHDSPKETLCTWCLVRPLEHTSSQSPRISPLSSQQRPSKLIYSIPQKTSLSHPQRIERQISPWICPLYLGSGSE